MIAWLQKWADAWLTRGWQWQFPAFLLIAGALFVLWFWVEWRGLVITWVALSFAQTTLFFPLMPLRWALGQFIAGTLVALIFAVGGKMHTVPLAERFHWDVGLTFRVLVAPLLLLFFISILPVRQYLPGLSHWQALTFILEIEAGLFILSTESRPLKVGMALLVYLWAAFFPLLTLHLLSDFWVLALTLLQLGIAWASSILMAWHTESEPEEYP